MSKRITYTEGDLFEDSFDRPTVIAHVCNNQGKWGSGFVVPLENRFPESAECYRAWHGGRMTDAHRDRVINSTSVSDARFAIGKTQFVRVQNESAPVVVANMVAQVLGGERPLRYNQLARCMDDVCEFIFDEPSMDVIGDGGKIICPMFGSGLAGGDWPMIEELIDDCWLRSGLDVEIYYFTKFLPNNFTPPPSGDNLREVV